MTANENSKWTPKIPVSNTTTNKQPNWMAKTPDKWTLGDKVKWKPTCNRCVAYIDVMGFKDTILREKHENIKKA
jgi:hypothetical protein